MFATIVSQMWGTDNNQGRTCSIYRDNDGYFIECYIDGVGAKLIELPSNSTLSDAESAADDWIFNVTNEKD